MRIAYAVSLAGLGAQALASNTSINSALNLVKDDTTALSSSLSSWNGNPFSALTVVFKAAKMYYGLVQCSHAATSSPQLTTDECLTASQTTGELTTALNSTLEAAIVDKPKFDRLHSSLIMYMAIKAMRKEYSDMNKNIVQKVPEEMRSNAQQLANGIDESFSKAVLAYSPKLEKEAQV